MQFKIESCYLFIYKQLIIYNFENDYITMAHNHKHKSRD